ncbi:XapX domain-containing protein (plasmid) [Rhizobium sp. RCAM05350]|nr:XapX domain-containing protein [Rhizobium sp. RCAM05350]
MKMYLLSLGAGLLVGVIYALINVRSPAPPVIALIGLLGILVGEQAVPLVKRLMSGDAVTVSWFNSHCVPHVFGELPTGPGHRQAAASGDKTGEAG